MLIDVKLHSTWPLALIASNIDLTGVNLAHPNAIDRTAISIDDRYINAVIAAVTVLRIHTNRLQAKTGQYVGS